jgi:xanthine dehydrogenase accessory factor
MSNHILHMIELMDEMREAGRDFCAVTVVRTANATSAKAGAKAIVTADGVVHGFVGGGCVEGAVRRAALAALASGEVRLIRVRPKEEVRAPVDVDGVELHQSSCPSGGTVDLFLEPMRHPVRLVVCGSSPVAASLTSLARNMGYRVIVAASSPACGDMPGASAYLDGFDLDGIGLESRDAVVVATQGRRDREALAAALRSPAAYVGMVGSRRKIAKLRNDLAADVPEGRLQALHGPAGLDIGAIEPEEIALAILCEIVCVRRSRNRMAVDIPTPMEAADLKPY